MAKPIKTASVDRSKASNYLAKAQQFLGDAKDLLDRGRYDSALLLAVHAGISSNDAITANLAGLVCHDPDHFRSVELLLQVAPQAKGIAEKAGSLRKLINLKNMVAYESRRVSTEEATIGVTRAERFVTWAAEIVLGLDAPGIV